MDAQFNPVVSARTHGNVSRDDSTFGAKTNLPNETIQSQIGNPFNDRLLLERLNSIAEDREFEDI